ncbi:threonylcarbamoyl-AMP synthase [Candidatus Woesearchaeota archaeon]|mgnify:CR=1 FL=1|nr:threonylcarbamoyl-AMP synthase [Candidatus Woesearchaeota archaeon]RLE43046.1 MAG: threonylcarbamoyl-AMP synthase [Candidatus Woesearchaeota archaeon]
MIITKNELWSEKERFAKKVVEGAIFLHPTDTINGLGCNALHDEAVKQLRKIKATPDNPFSVIAPSKDWIKENCVIDEKAEAWLNKLPGPYTLVLKLKNKNAVSKHVNPKDDTIGIRIPNHWISEFVSHIGIPVITTSANVRGHEYNDDLDELHPKIKNGVEFMIYEVRPKGSPSDIVILTEEKPRIIKRSKQK